MSNTPILKLKINELEREIKLLKLYVQLLSKQNKELENQMLRASEKR